MRGLRVLSVLVIVALGGCSEQGATEEAGTNQNADSSRIRARLSDLSVVYAQASGNGGCESLEEFKATWSRLGGQSFAEGLPELIESGEIIVRWGIELPRNASDENYGKVVVAYASDVPMTRGWVVFDDATTVEWTAAEFQEQFGPHENPN